MATWFELHKHSMFSIFDGYGSPKDIVKQAVTLGYPAVSITDHGNVCSCLKLYNEAKKAGIQPILGCEVYFQPTFKPGEQSFHMNIIAKSATGYQSLMAIMSRANREHFYRKPIVLFEDLQELGREVIITSACVGGYLGQAIMAGKLDKARKFVRRMQGLVGEDFYIEIMPQPIDAGETQHDVNQQLLALCKEFNVEYILTNDSHYTSKADWDTYKMMRRMAHYQGDLEQVYSNRHMLSEREMLDMAYKDIGKARSQQALQSLESLRCKVNIELDFGDAIPLVKGTTKEKYGFVYSKCMERLRDCTYIPVMMRKQYSKRLKYELDTISGQGLLDYFIIVQDYVNYAKANDIYVGPGRGSVCGSLVAFGLRITEVDPILHNNIFERFMDPNRKKMPDIDLDFEFEAEYTKGRQAVLKYIDNKYKGSAAHIISYGFYRSSNLLNDLAKQMDIQAEDLFAMKKVLGKICGDQEHVDIDVLGVDRGRIYKDRTMQGMEQKYPGLTEHFCRLYGQVRYLGKHAAGILLVNGKLEQYTSVMRSRDEYVCTVDKYGIEENDLLKVDVLGLKTLNVIHKVELQVGKQWEIAGQVAKAKAYEQCATGDVASVFQLSSRLGQSLCNMIKPSCLDELVALIALNRPGPIKNSLHIAYVENKSNPNTELKWYDFVKDTYGVIIYQEQIMQICQHWNLLVRSDIDKVMKRKFSEEELVTITAGFMKQARKAGFKREEANQLIDQMISYTFNKAHSVGYALITEQCLFYKCHYPAQYWAATLELADEEDRLYQFNKACVKSGTILMLPHVNYGMCHSMRIIDGEEVVQEGYSCIKNVGAKAAELIQAEFNANGIFHTELEFRERMQGKGRAFTVRTLEALKNAGALNFSKSSYERRVVQYNTALFERPE